MTSFAADENFDNRILRGLKHRCDEFDIVRIQDTGLMGADDPAVLEWAATENRVLLTHDVNTMIAYAGERLAEGLPMAGVLLVQRPYKIPEIIESIELLIHFPEECEGQIMFLPLD